jgi:hypothetical protein
MVMARVSAIACGHKDAIDLDRLRYDPLMKVAVGRCPASGAPLASQSTISRLENAPSRTEPARLTAALVDQAGTTVKPRRQEILDIDDTFCAAHGGQQLVFWNAHHDERGFASMHIYHVASGTPVVTILRPGVHPEGHRGEDRHQARDKAHEETLAGDPDGLARRQSLRSRRGHVADLSHSLSGVSEAVYADSGHLLPKGNEIVASHMLDQLVLCGLLR